MLRVRVFLEEALSIFETDKLCGLVAAIDWPKSIDEIWVGLDAALPTGLAGSGTIFNYQPCRVQRLDDGKNICVAVANSIVPLLARIVVSIAGIAHPSVGQVC